LHIEGCDPCSSRRKGISGFKGVLELWMSVPESIEFRLILKADPVKMLVLSSKVLLTL